VPTTNVGLRFSASSADKYHNCHGSANLPAAIPGFEFTPRPIAKARDQGTALHKVLENTVLHSTSLVEAAQMFRQLADVYGKNRTALLEDPVAYLTWWFMINETVPPVEYEYVQPLLFQGEGKVESTPPALIKFLADAIDFIAEILVDGGEVQTEVTVKATWLKTEPNTTVDIIIRQGEHLYIIDLKAGTTPVEAMNNNQLLYYTACFLEQEEYLHLIILQRNNISEWAITRNVVETWMDQMQESEQAILDGDLTLRVGSWCTFCSANPRSRGDKGYPFCPEMIELLYGAQDDLDVEKAILED